MTIKERPILFSGEMVRAILDGCKTQTRRVCRLTDNGMLQLGEGTATPLRDGIGPVWRPYGGAPEQPLPADRLSGPYGKPGDLLWVRETWQSEKDMEVPVGNAADVVYRATDEDGWIEYEFDWKWRPSIHMPRWASRITLEVTDVRVERVQKITEAGAIAEGIYMESDYASLCINQETAGYNNELPKGSAVLAVFKNLWDTLNAKRGYSWDSNPWVWIVEFKHIEGKP